LQGPQAVIVSPLGAFFGVEAGALAGAALRGGVAGGFSSEVGALTGVPQPLQKRDPAGRLAPQFTQNTIVVLLPDNTKEKYTKIILINKYLFIFLQDN